MDKLTEEVNGKVEVREGSVYWMGTLVEPCPACGVAPTNVDDCGHFGDPHCPYFGVKGASEPKEGE